MKNCLQKIKLIGLIALAFFLCSSLGQTATTIGTNAEFLITNSVDTYLVPLTANSSGWLIWQKPEWLKITPEPVDVDTVFMNGRYYLLNGAEVDSSLDVITMPMLPAISQIYIKLEGENNTGTATDSLILQNLDTGNIWMGRIRALFDNGQNTTQATRIVVNTNTASKYPISLAVNTGVSGTYFVFFEHPHLLPGQKYALTREGRLTLFSSYGFPVANAEDLFFAEGVDNVSVNLGDIPMAGLEGTLIAQISRSTPAEMVTAYEVYYNIASLSGDWEITDFYQGVESTYSAQIHEGGGLFNGKWDRYPFTAEYTLDGYYRISFSDGRYQYQYIVRGLNNNEMSGEWSYSGEPDKLYTFSGRKKNNVGSLFPISDPIVGNWNFTSSENSCCCAGPGIFKGQGHITQTGTELVLEFNNNVKFTGTIDDNTIVFTGSFVHGSGMVHVRASATLMNQGAKIYGTGRWLYITQDSECSGTTKFEATKQ